MFKINELTDAKSCLNKATPGEMLFVLLGRDIAAPSAIRAWIEERIRVGKNSRTDDQITEAEACARYMEQIQTFNKPSGNDQTDPKAVQ